MSIRIHAVINVITLKPLVASVNRLGRNSPRTKFLKPNISVLGVGGGGGG